MDGFKVMKKNAIFLELMELMPFVILESKESVQWVSSFQIWKNIFHPCHLGIHLTFKQGNQNIFVLDGKCIEISKLLKTRYSTLNSRRSTLEEINITYNENLVKKIAKTVLSFFAYIHKKGIVYGKMSFTNILVSTKRNFYVNASTGMSRSAIKTFLIYAAPEVVSSSNYSTASDIWNLGILLYILFFRSYPFSTDSEESLKNDILNKDLNFPTFHQCGNIVSKRAHKFLLLLLNKNPNERGIAANLLGLIFFKFFF